MALFVDTSALYALIDRDDPVHGLAAGTLGEVVRLEPLLTHNYVVVETIALVERRLGRAGVDKLLDEILPVVETTWIDRDTHVSVVSAYRRASARASFVDHTSFEFMRLQELRTAFAFDVDFRTAGFELVP
ncbi:MAG: PIN domain-containing protein [Actinobacteria bacterium]|nr:PIN domain-containing protein [Actinomycetota bacterium]